MQDSLHILTKSSIASLVSYNAWDLLLDSSEVPYSNQPEGSSGDSGVATTLPHGLARPKVNRPATLIPQRIL